MLLCLAPAFCLDSHFRCSYTRFTDTDTVLAVYVCMFSIVSLSFANHLWNLIDETAFCCYRRCCCFCFCCCCCHCRCYLCLQAITITVEPPPLPWTVLFHLTVGHKFWMNCWRHGSNQFVFDHSSFCIPPAWLQPPTILSIWIAPGGDTIARLLYRLNQRNFRCKIE